MENNKQLLSEEFASYKKVLEDKCNFFLSDLNKLDHSDWTVTMTKNTYEKLGRKHFPKKATESETKVITARQLACYLTSIGFFKDRVEKSYTQLGCKATRLTCVRPDEEVKIERIFSYEYNN